MRIRSFCPRALLLLALACAFVVRVSAADPAAPSFRYGDLDSFAQALAEIDAGKEPVAALQGYLDRASPGLKTFMGVYGVTADKIAAEVKRRPNYFRSLTKIRTKIEAMEPAMADELRRLAALAPGTALTPVYFFVAQRTAGGIARDTEEPDGTKPRSLLIAVELLGIDDTTDLTEFATGHPGIFVKDIPQVVVHEMVHVIQVQAQGLDNYVSIYRQPEKGTLLAFAIREGTGEFLTALVSGRQLGERQHYGPKNEEALWRAFSAVMHEPQSKHPEWFSGGKSEQFPDLPMQTGYFIGQQICRAFYDAAADKTAAINLLLTAHTPEQWEEILAPYAKRWTAPPKPRAPN